MIYAARYSDIGAREHNEDSAFFSSTAKMCVAAVADGLGGHGGGEIASATAVERLAARSEELRPLDETKVKDVCTEMNDAILAKQTEQTKMKSTLAMLLFDGAKAALTHIGDSRAYLFRDSRMFYQSVDHSVSQLAVFAGEITPEQIRFHPDRSKVLRVLGDSEGCKPDIHWIEGGLCPGDAVLLCTDGFWEHVLEAEMCQALSKCEMPEQWLRRMLTYMRARNPQKQDNNTAVALMMRA